MVIRHLSGARYGMRDWLTQRVTAILMALYVIILISFVVTNSPVSFQDWREFVLHPWLRFISFLIFVAMVLHAWVGIRDVLMDYVRHTGVRLTLQMMAILSLAFYLLWAAQILWS